MYPFYDKAVKAGITTLCIHKGLLPPDYGEVVRRRVGIRNCVGTSERPPRIGRR